MWWLDSVLLLLPKCFQGIELQSASTKYTYMRVQLGEPLKRNPTPAQTTPTTHTFSFSTKQQQNLSQMDMKMRTTPQHQLWPGNEIHIFITRIMTFCTLYFYLLRWCGAAGGWVTAAAKTRSANPNKILLLNNTDFILLSIWESENNYSKDKRILESGGEFWQAQLF